MNMRNSVKVLPILAIFLYLGMPAWAEQVVNIDIPISATVFDPCSSELVDISGTAHLTVNVTVNGNTSHFGVHINGEGIQGVGETSGAQYHLVGAANLEANGHGSGGEITAVFNLNFVGQGQVPNLRAKLTFHVTANANGDVTAEFLKIDLDCS